MGEEVTKGVGRCNLQNGELHWRLSKVGVNKVTWLTKWTKQKK